MVGQVHVSPEWLLTGEGKVFLDGNSADLACQLLSPENPNSKIDGLPASEVLRVLAREIHLAVQTGAIEYVRGPSTVDKTAPHAAPGRILSPLSAVAIDGLIMVPKVAARLSAGGGSFEASAEIKGHYAFREEWLRAKGNPEDMVLMEVSGDSMEPELRDGDTVLINQGQVDVLDGKVYAVGVEDTVVVKQVERLPGVLVLRSTNPAHKPREIDMRGDLAAMVRIIGRVIWWCHEAR